MSSSGDDDDCDQIKSSLQSSPTTSCIEGNSSWRVAAVSSNVDLLMSDEKDGEPAAATPKVVFKKVKNKNYCRRRKDDSDEDDSGNGDESLIAKLEESKELRKYRRRQAGVSAEGLLVGETTAKKEGVDDDPFKTKCGGMVDLNQVKNAKKTSDDAYDTGIGTAFSVETNRRDEDAEMQKYIEENLAKRKGIESEDMQEEQSRYQTLDEVALHAVPSMLRESTSKRSEEMLSNQESGPAKKKEKRVQEIVEPVVGGGVKISTIAPKRPHGEKATDDFHYEKFKKQHRLCQIGKLSIREGGHEAKVDGNVGWLCCLYKMSDVPNSVSVVHPRHETGTIRHTKL
ncbi:uncharacterized protein E2C01_013972 [Portunus trituberculatus]|uniref:Uncharacterized protein n=1 Tax=Portunus trituberculatus TaxID=210409 RepID=A0A5B7DIW5_PORTR|nr:uncharacterized protein [Portunus trituberculatus]